MFAGPSSIRREPPASLRETGFGGGGIPQLPSSSSSSSSVSASQAYVPPRSVSSGPPAPVTTLNPDGSKKMWGYANPNYRERTLAPRRLAPT